MVIHSPVSLLNWQRQRFMNWRANESKDIDIFIFPHIFQQNSSIYLVWGNFSSISLIPNIRKRKGVRYAIINIWLLNILYNGTILKKKKRRAFQNNLRLKLSIRYLKSFIILQWIGHNFTMHEQGFLYKFFCKWEVSILCVLTKLKIN